MIKEKHRILSNETANSIIFVPANEGHHRLSNELPIGVVSSMWNDQERTVGEGRRRQWLQSLSLMGGFPILLATDTISEGDSGGTMIFLLCCILVFYVFSITGWSNKEIKK